MKVSIIFSTYNQAKFLKQSIDSILNQTHKDFELIVINNGATDNTAELLTAINDSRISIINQEHQSLGATLANGFSKAQGEYLTFTTADNIFLPNWLSELVNALSSYSTDVGCMLSHHAVTDSNGNILFIDSNQRFDIPSLLMKKNENISFLYRASIHHKLPAFNTLSNDAEIDDFWVHLSSVSHAGLLDKVLCYHRISNTSEPDRALPSNAYKFVLDKFLARTGGQFVIDYLFPSINISKNPEFERFKARLRFATLAFDTIKYCPIDSTIDLIMQALIQSYDETLVANIAHLYVKDGRWDDASIMINEYYQKNPSPFLDNLKHIIDNADQSELEKIPFITLDENYLATDCDSKRSKTEILRNFASSQTKTIEENIGFFAQIVTELINGLSDEKDHPEIWQAISSFESDQEKLRLTKLRTYIEALIRVPQEPKVKNLLMILEAMCCSATNNIESGKVKLKNILDKNPSLTTAKGALDYIS